MTVIVALLGVMLAGTAPHMMLPGPGAGTTARLGHVTNPPLRALAGPALPITHWKTLQVCAIASSDVLSCPWPRTFEQDRVPPRVQGRGGIASTFVALRKVHLLPGPGV